MKDNQKILELEQEVQSFREDLQRVIQDEGFELDISKPLHPLVKDILQNGYDEGQRHYKNLLIWGMSTDEIRGAFVEYAKGVQYVADVFGISNRYSDITIISSDDYLNAKDMPFSNPFWGMQISDKFIERIILEKREGKDIYCKWNGIKIRILFYRIWGA